MVEYSRQDAAERAGVSVNELSRLVELGVLKPDGKDRFSTGDVRRVGMVQNLVAAGIPFDRLTDALRSDHLSLAFMDDPAFERFAPLSSETFQELSARTGIPLQLLMIVREVLGLVLPKPEDRVREDELAIVPLIQLELAHGFRPIVIEGWLRVIGDSMRRVAETENEAWRSEVLAPLFAAGSKANEIRPATADLWEQLVVIGPQALLAIYQAQQAHSWTTNIIGRFESALANAGLAGRIERLPAMCFLDITGYTRLTQERGDEAAAALAAELARLVERTSVRHGGRPIKWLGDGVMFFFKEPGQGVVAALEMVDAVISAGLPPAHVGLHAGPVIFQEGDYFGQTVNVASRIADYARPGEVLVSQAVVDASGGVDVSFAEIGPVELKGVAGAMRLHAAHRGSS